MGALGGLVDDLGGLADLAGDLGDGGGELLGGAGDGLDVAGGGGAGLRGLAGALGAFLGGGGEGAGGLVEAVRRLAHRADQRLHLVAEVRDEPVDLALATTAFADGGLAVGRELLPLESAAFSTSMAEPSWPISSLRAV